MASKKQPKAELIATIYRLEFYKNQKNWKLGSARKEKKTPRKTETKSTLNVTYDVDNASKKEVSDPHNVAFVESDSDKNSTNKTTHHSTKSGSNLSRQWQEPVNIWPQKAKPNIQLDTDINKPNISIPNIEPKKNYAQKRLEELQKAAISYECSDVLNEFVDYYPSASENIIDVSWRGNEKFVLEVGGGAEWEDGGWVDTECADQYVWQQGADVDVADGAEVPPQTWSQEWFREQLLMTDGADWTRDLGSRDSNSSLDSACSFIRGAHAAPHSSEVDLALPPGLRVPELSPQTVSRLSGAQLALAARLHSRALAGLLREGEARQKLRRNFTLACTDSGSCEEFPTRDVGPSCPLDTDYNPQNIFKDVFLSGSHRNRDLDIGVGRGRGRLDLRSKIW